MNKPKQHSKFAFGLIEGVLTLAGIVTVVAPLALWAVPQHGYPSVLVFYLILSIGGGAFLVFVGLARLQALLFPEQMPGGKIDLASLHQRRIDWEQEQEDKLRAGQQGPTEKGSALREVGYMGGIATLLALASGLILLAAWVFIQLRYS